jgi:hypothetical protein
VKRIALRAAVVCLGLSAPAGHLRAEITATALHAFVGTDGSHPLAALVEGHDHNFYGSTSTRGSGPTG